MSHQTGIENYYIIKDNRKLRYGYTTGSCAAAAAKGAALMLLSGNPLSHVTLMTPKGIELDLLLWNTVWNLPEEGLEGLPAQPCTRVPEPGSAQPAARAPVRPHARRQGEWCGAAGQRSVTCAVQKDAGDDPDATDGILVYATVIAEADGLAEAAGAGQTSTLLPENRIVIGGGPGVGRVTRPGMQQAVGEAAINPVPMQMIRDEVARVCTDFEYAGSLKVIISIPRGREIAQKTFNPRLGIEGGISVLGTSGIVIPMSEAALIESIRLEMRMLRGKGHEYLLITPGNYGETFTKNEMTIDLSSSMKCSNYVGETLDLAVNMGVKGVLFVAHIGKFIKVAGGIMNTHSRDADCRAELMAAFALRAGADRETAMRILGSITTDEALTIMEEKGVRRKAMELAAEKVQYYMQHRVGEAIRTEAVLFSGAFGYLTQTPGAEELLRHFSTPAPPGPGGNGGTPVTP